MPPVRGYVSLTRARGLMSTSAYSCPDKEGRSSSGWWQVENKVQDQVLALSVHAVARRCRKGGEAEAEPATWCVCSYGAIDLNSDPCSSVGLRVVEVKKTSKK